MNSSPKKPDSSIPYKHVLQTTGLLKSFGIAKIVRGDELRDLKRLLKSVAGSKEEYDSMLHEEIDKLSRLGDSKNPIPGMILSLGTVDRSTLVIGSAKTYAKKLKRLGWSKEMICFYILALIKELGVSQDDFDRITDGTGDNDTPFDDSDDGNDDGDEDSADA
jgi:hypothetical protein